MLTIQLLDNLFKINLLLHSLLYNPDQIIQYKELKWTVLCWIPSIA